MRYLLLFLYFFLLIGCEFKSEVKKSVSNESVNWEYLINELSSIDNEDQRYRVEIINLLESNSTDTAKISALGKKINEVDSINQQKVFKLLDTLGWPDKKIIGEEGAKTIWAVLQHSDLDVQEKYFPLLSEAVQESKLDAKYLAYTEDRILMYKGLKQKYGTQFGQQKGSAAYMMPLENPEKVDSLRATVNLTALKVFLKDKWSLDWDLSTYYKDLPKAEKSLQKFRKRYLSKVKDNN